MFLDKALLNCVSSDVTRSSIAHVYVDVTDQIAVATNGHAIVVVPITPDPEEVSGFVPREAILEAAKLPKSRKGQLTHLAKTTVVNRIAYPNPGTDSEEPLTFPEWRQLVPRVLMQQAPQLSFNSALLADLGHALHPGNGPSYITITYDLQKPLEGPMVIRPHGDPDDKHFALLMPYRNDKVEGHQCLSREGLRDELVTQKAETETLRNELATLKATHAEAMQHIISLEATLAEQPPTIQDTVTALETQYATMETQYQALVTQHAAIQEDYEVLMRDLTTLIAHQS